MAIQFQAQQKPRKSPIKGPKKVDPTLNEVVSHLEASGIPLNNKVDIHVDTHKKHVDTHKKEVDTHKLSNVDTHKRDRHKGKQWPARIPADLFAAIEASRISRHQTRAEWLKSALEALERDGR